MSEKILSLLRRAFEKDPNLPTLPEHVRRILALLEDPDVAFPVLCREIEKDPAIALRIVRLANSAIYGQTREVNSLPRAFAVIGLKQVSTLLAGIASVDSCERFLDDPQFDWGDFWGHCSGTAYIAGSLAGRLDLQLGGSEFLGGLLHDIGYLALAKANASIFTQAVQEAEEQQGFLAPTLARKFGVTQEQAGAVLGEVSELAPELLAVIRYVHEPGAAPDGLVPLVATVSLANELAHAIGLTFYRGPAEVETVIPELPGWRALSELRPEMGDWDLARLTFELEREYAASSDFVKETRQPV